MPFDRIASLAKIPAAAPRRAPHPPLAGSGPSPKSISDAASQPAGSSVTATSRGGCVYGHDVTRSPAPART